MEHKQSKEAVLDVVDVYKSQQRYEERKVRNREILSWIFIAVSIIVLAAVFVFPLYEYNLIGKRDGDLTIIGNFSAIEIFIKLFNNELGSISVLNTCSAITSLLIIITSIYLVVFSLLSVVYKGKDKLPQIMKRAMKFETIEFVGIIEFIIILANMIFTKLDVSGNANNGTAFWILFFGSIFMICSSISISENPDK